MLQSDLDTYISILGFSPEVWGSSTQNDRTLFEATFVYNEPAADTQSKTTELISKMMSAMGLRPFQNSQGLSCQETDTSQKVLEKLKKNPSKIFIFLGENPACQELLSNNESMGQILSSTPNKDFNFNYLRSRPLELCLTQQDAKKELWSHLQVVMKFLANS